MSFIMNLIQSELCELFALEFAKIAESDFVYIVASTNIWYIDFTQHSRRSTSQNKDMVIKKIQFVYFQIKTGYIVGMISPI